MRLIFMGTPDFAVPTLVGHQFCGADMVSGEVLVHTQPHVTGSLEFGPPVEGEIAKY